jgi:hypothetical protein
MSRGLPALVLLASLTSGFAAPAARAAVEAIAGEHDCADGCPEGEDSCGGECTFDCLCICCPLKVRAPTIVLTPLVTATPSTEHSFPLESEPVALASVADIFHPPRA